MANSSDVVAQYGRLHPCEAALVVPAGPGVVLLVQPVMQAGRAMQQPSWLLAQLISVASAWLPLGPSVASGGLAGIIMHAAAGIQLAAMLHAVMDAV
jgi:hypothetical protein